MDRGKLAATRGTARHQASGINNAILMPGARCLTSYFTTLAVRMKSSLGNSRLR
jgi:hypothetical protein